MRVLIVLPEDEGKTRRKGFAVRARHFALALAARHDVDVLVANDLPPLLRAVDIAVASALALARGWPLQAALFDGPLRAARVRARVRDGRPDAVLIVTERLPFTLIGLRGHAVVLGAVDALASAFAQRASASRGRAWLWRRESRAFRRLEPVLARAARAVVVSAARELGGYPRAIVIPNGIAPIAAARPTHDLIFTGNLDFWSNDEAVLELCREVVPRLRARRPETTVLVAGNGPRRAARDACRAAGIDLVANPSDITACLARARIAVAPLRHATGTQLKVYEAIGAGLPVVAYPVVIDGLPPDLPGVFAVSDASAMAERCVQLLDAAPVPRPDVSRFSWDARAAELERVLIDAARSVGPR